MNRFFVFFLTGIILLGVSCNRTKPKNEGEGSIDSISNILPVDSVQGAEQIEEVITKFARAYISRDSQKVNALIHPVLKLTIIYRPGVADSYHVVDHIDFSNPFPEYYDYPEMSNDFALTFGKLPVFDCDKFTWSSKGFVCDTTAHPKQLSSINAYELKFNKDHISKKEMEEIKRSEDESYRVVLTGDGDKSLVFHVRKYKGSWYVTTLDRAVTNCDA